MNTIVVNGMNELSFDDLILVNGGFGWDSFFDFVGGVAVVSAAIPGAQGVTIIAGSAFAGYKLGKAIAGK